MIVKEMKPKERWKAVLTHNKPDRVPMDYWATNEVTAALIKHFQLTDKSIPKIIHGFQNYRFIQSSSKENNPYEIMKLTREMLQHLKVDFVVRLQPQYVGPELEKDADVFGCRYKVLQHKYGYYTECVYHPLAEYESVKEIQDNFKWPRPEWWDYSTIPEQIKGYVDYPIRAGGSEPFLYYKYLRGDEQAFIDLLLFPDIINYCLDKLYELAYESTKRTYSHIGNKENLLILTYINEDLGSQNGLLYSPEHIHKFFFPRMKQMIDFAHSEGAFVFHHDDGSIDNIIPDLIDLGIDILNPIQWRLPGMDRDSLNRKYGSKLVFHGAMDNQQTLPFGSIQNVKDEVIQNIEILGRDNGYILAPCHNIQPNTPLENIIVLYDTGYKYT